MANLPYSRVVNVTLSRNQNYPTRRGFGIQLILTHDAVAGKVDGTTRTKLYASMEEIAADFATSTSVYKAALAAFSRNPRPTSLKVGYVATPAGADDAAKKADFIASLDSLNEYDSSFYVITIDAAMRDQAYLDGLIEWTQAKPKMAFIDSNDALMQDPNDTTNIAARNKNLFDRSAVFYHTNVEAYTASSMAAYLATRNFDNANTAYTGKFKQVPGIEAVNIGTAAVTAVSGFVEAVGMATSVGHCANTVISIGDRPFLVEGSTLTQNVFIDEIHATDWIIARTEEEVLAIFLNNARVPYTDAGMGQLAAAPLGVMQQAVQTGIVANDLNPETQEYAPAYIINIPSISSVPESQRKARIAPPIEIQFRYAGAVHYAVINYTMTF